MDPFYIGRLSWIIMIISSSLKRKSPLKLYGKRPQTVRGGGSRIMIYFDVDDGEDTDSK